MTRPSAAQVLTVIVLTAVTILPYYAMSEIVNQQPPTPPFPGWVSILAESTEAHPETTDQVLLKLQAGTPGAPGSNPEVLYTVAVCGDQPFRGALLLGGASRLHEVRTFPNSEDAAALKDITHLAIEHEGASTYQHLGAVQYFPLDIQPLGPCTSTSYSSDQTPPAFLGEAVGLDGAIGAPLQWSGIYLGVAGPRSSEVWPRVGGLPNYADNDLGQFHTEGELAGDWVRPVTQINQVGIGGISPHASVDLAQPPLTNQPNLGWSSFTPIAPALRITDVDSLGVWQQRLVVAGIVLGVGGSLLATILYEWLRPLLSQSSSERLSDPDAQKTPPSRLPAIVWVAFLLSMYWLSTRHSTPASQERDQP